MVKYQTLEIPTEYHPATEEEFTDFLSSLDDKESWTSCYNDAGKIQVWYKKSDVSPINEIKIEANWQHINPDDLYDVLHDSTYRRTWDKNAIDNDLIEQIDSKNDIGYYSAKCPTGIANRDFVNIRSWQEKPEHYLIMNHSVAHPNAPVKKNFVRANSIKTGYLIRRSEKGCVVTYITITDPKGSIPVMVFNKLTQKMAPKVLDRLAKAALEYPAWKTENQPEHKPWRS